MGAAMPEAQSKVLPALYGGIIIGILSGVPGLNLINCCCCAGILFGGFLSVLFYTRELDAPPITSGDALLLGTLSGVFGAFIATAISVVVLATFGPVVVEFLREMLDRVAENIPPDVYEEADASLNESLLLGPRSILITFVKSIILCPLFGLLGGLIGYATFKPKPQTLTPPPAIPPTTI